MLAQGGIKDILSEKNNGERKNGGVFKRLPPPRLMYTTVEVKWRFVSTKPVICHKNNYFSNSDTKI